MRDNYCSSSLYFINCLQFFFHLSISPLPSLSPLPLLLCVLLSPCRTHLCTINLPTNELEPLTLSLLLSTAAVPYLCSIFLPLFLTQPFYCSIDRHVISYMNNARSETKIVALLLSLGWDLFCNSLTECAWADFYSAVPATLLNGIGILDVKVLRLPKLHSYRNRLERLIVRSGCRFIQPLSAHECWSRITGVVPRTILFISQRPEQPHQHIAKKLNFSQCLLMCQW